MISPLILFAVTLFLLALFFAVKEHEIYTGTTFFTTRLSEKYSPRAQRWCRKMHTKIGQLFSKVFTIFRKSIHRLYEQGIFLLQKVILRIAGKAIDMVKGNGVLDKKGLKSFYLERIQEHKENLEVERDTKVIEE